MRLNVLFVDDDANILRGVRRSLRMAASEWTVVVASSAAEGLDRMAERRFDAVVSDLHMPIRGGVEFLQDIAERWPAVMRIVASGTCDQGRVLDSVNVAHQYVAKPYDMDALKDSIEDAMSWRRMLADENLATFVGGIRRLPSLPESYSRITAACADHSKSLREIGDLVAADVALSAKIVQIANSAFFGLSRRVASPGDAAAILGVNALRALVLGADVFASAAQGDGDPHAMQRLWQHSLEVATRARCAATRLQCDREVAEGAFFAGMVHEVGSLILLMERPLEVAEAEVMSKRSGRLRHEVEEDLIGTTHAHIAGYLLATWGLPPEIIESVVFHHCSPSRIDRGRRAVNAW